MTASDDVDEGDRRPMIAQVPLARVDGRYVPADEHPDAPVVVQEGERYHVDAVDEEGSR